MSTAATLQVTTVSGDETEQLGALLGSRCQGGEIFELIGDLGAGKTAFVRGLARGLGITEDVTSPSYTINNVYKGATRNLQHFDFYRLGEAGVVAEEFKEAVFDPMNVIAVEWGEAVADILPNTHLTVIIRLMPDESRQITVESPKNLAYVIEASK